MPTRELTSAEKIRRLPWSWATNSLNGIFVTWTFGGSVFMLFLDQLGLDKGQIGRVLLFFPFCGLSALVLAPFVAQAGFKRTFIAAWTARTAVFSALLLTPLVVNSWGGTAAVHYVSAVILIFALCRAIGETGYYPWLQEFVPNSIRGKYGAISGVLSSITSIFAVVVASLVLANSAGLNGFMLLIGLGIIVGFASMVCAGFIPGGRPLHKSGVETPHFRGMLEAVEDRDLLMYLSGMSFVSLAMGLLAFLPLFMKEEVGLHPGTVVLLDAAGTVGGMLSAYAWGWAADRYGSKPVMLTGLYSSFALPILWTVIPRHSPMWSAPAALGMSFIWGLTTAGLFTGSSRLLFNSVVPAQKKTAYMAVFYAWAGVVGGLGPLAAGAALNYLKTTRIGVEHPSLWIVTIDPYTPLFAAALLLLVAGAIIYSRVRPDSRVETSDFVRMFFRGDAVAAATSLIEYSRAHEEKERVSVAQRLGDARSPLNVDELIESLSDPSFNVRYAAIIAAGRSRPDERLVNALINVLVGHEPELSVASAWSLGRLGDKHAVLPLREVLVTGRPLLQAHAARALGALGDEQIAPVLLERFRAEPDVGLRVALASALGALGSREAAGEMLALLRGLTDQGARMEVALALARAVAHEQYFIRIWRQTHTEPGTAISSAMLALKRKMRLAHLEGEELMAATEDCSQAFASDELPRAAALLARVIRALPAEAVRESYGTALRECEARLNEWDESRMEYVLLALHTIDAALTAIEKERQTDEDAHRAF